MNRCVASIVIVGTAAGLVEARTNVDALVVSVSGQSVYINIGKSSRVAIGSRVVFVLKTGERVNATVVDVTTNSARAELQPDSLVPEIDDRAEVEVEDAAPAPTQPTAEESKSKPPEHPPWEAKVGDRSADTPLLAPAFGVAPKDRPTTVKGRIFTMARATEDLQNDSTYSYLRAGTWLEVTNPFHDGGRILFEADADYRNSDSFGGGSSSQKVRIKRLSYAWGLDQHAGVRGEVGRYYSQYLPEVGLIDGGEVAWRFEDGWSFGAGAGLYPTTSDDLLVTHDYGFHTFADYQSEGKESWFQGTAGFQQTWHDGQEDRTLLIGRLNMRPSRDLSVFGTMLVDVYDSHDVVKSQAADITLLVLQSSYSFNPKTGVNGSFTRTTWPELKRSEYANLPPELLLSGFVNRISGSVWRKVVENVRVTGQAHYWVDQDRTGWGGEASVDWFAGGENNSSYYGSLYYEDSSFTTGFGGRFQARRQFGQVQAFVGYDFFAYSTDTLFGSGGNFVRHTVRADASWSTGRWSWDIEGDYNFGDSEETLGLSLYAQYRF